MINGINPPYTVDPYEISDERLMRIAGGKVLFQEKDMTQFPSRTDVLYSIVMTKEYLKKYEAVERKIKDDKAKKSYGRGSKNKDKDKDGPSNAFLSALRKASNVLEPCLKCNLSVDIIVYAVRNNRKVIFYSEFLETGTDEITNRLDALGIVYKKINGKTTKPNRTKAVKEYNDPTLKLNLLIITKAGGEGLDLVGTRDVVLFEKGWTFSGMEQVIGRGIRFRSHKHLPEDQQNIKIHHIVIVKPTDLINPKYINAIQNYSSNHVIINTDNTDVGDVTMKDMAADPLMFNKAYSKDIENRSLYDRLYNMQVGMVEPIWK
jgi:superfamily II DNA or RNA helicase